MSKTNYRITHTCTVAQQRISYQGRKPPKGKNLSKSCLLWGEFAGRHACPWVLANLVGGGGNYRNGNFNCSLVEGIATDSDL